MPVVLIIMVVLPKRMRRFVIMLNKKVITYKLLQCSNQKGRKVLDYFFLGGGGVVKIFANDDFSSSKYIECCF